MFPTPTAELNSTIGLNVQHHPHVAKAFTLKDVAKKGSEQVKQVKQIYQTYSAKN